MVPAHSRMSSVPCLIRRRRSGARTAAGSSAAIETSEGLDLTVICERPKQEIALEAGGWWRPHLPPPLRPQLLEAETAQPRDLSFDSGVIGHRAQPACSVAGALRSPEAIR
jgi:hypothetical protein